MTYDEILKLNACDATDILVARKVFNFTWHISGLGVEFYNSPEGSVYLAIEIPDYSTRIDDAWKIVEKFKKENAQVLDFDIRWKDGYYSCCFMVDTGYDIQNFIASAPTAPLAICRAALLAAMEDK